MHYLSKQHIESLERNWKALSLCITEAVECMNNHDYAQPVKPYLRYRDLRNRIIAMPAFVGGKVDVAGIKWIASFPLNHEKGLDRAQSVTILNDAGTGVPFCIINTSLISAIRTAAVSMAVLEKCLEARPARGPLKVGMTGFGPIGQLHYEMVSDLLGERLESFSIYDIRNTQSQADHPGPKVKFVQSYTEAYNDADIFITATTATQRYITQDPKKGSIHLNVSLRDYDPCIIGAIDKMIVDNWEEVCRENTDIEQMALTKGLRKEHTLDIVDVICGEALKSAAPGSTVMFNPMGMAIFDMVIAKHYYQLALQHSVGCSLN